MKIDDLIDRVRDKTGKHPKRSGKNYYSLCPAHDDNNPSLSLAEGDNGKILIHCHAGCELKSICIALGITEKDLFPDKSNSQESFHNYTVRTEYVYRDADGVPLYKKIRIEPGSDGRKKDFRILSKTEAGSWDFGLKVNTRVLYQLPDIIEAIKQDNDVYIVEGEKDAERCNRTSI